MRSMLLSLGLALLVGCTTFTALPDPTPRDGRLVGQALDSVVALVDETGRSYCAGVFVEEYVLTAAHCVEPEIEPRVRTRQSEESVTARIVHFDPGTDLAVLSPNAVMGTHAIASLAPFLPRIGDKVIAVGHPLGVSWYITSGLSNGVRSGWDGQEYFFHSAPISPGNSGGPVFNEYGEVTGINSYILLYPNLGSQNHLAAAVPLFVLEAALYPN